jgi:hypothetical protein
MMTVVIYREREAQLMSGLRDPDSSAGQKTGILSMRDRKDVKSRLSGISLLEEFRRGLGEI